MFQSEELQVLEIRRKFTLQVPTKSLSQRVYSTSYFDRFFLGLVFINLQKIVWQ